MGHNAIPLKDNCALFATTPLFSLRAIRWCDLNFSPVDLRCHGNDFWNETDYNSAPVKDSCALFALTLSFRPRAIRRRH